MLLVAKAIGGLIFGTIGVLIFLFPRKVYEIDQRIAPFVKSFPVYRIFIWLLFALPFTYVGVATVYWIITDSLK